MLKSKSLRLVIDTNLWISFIISNRFSQLDEILLANNVKILFSAELIAELESTIAKPKLKKYFSKNAFAEMLDVFDDYIELITVTSKVKICRDANDDFLLALAKDGKADYLLTGDNDLLEIGKFGGTKIMKIGDFLEKLKL
mgnify:CR=1 FL=1